jgi:hypothetical protein
MKIVSDATYLLVVEACVKAYSKSKTTDKTTEDASVTDTTGADSLSTPADSEITPENIANVACQHRYHQKDNTYKAGFKFSELTIVHGTDGRKRLFPTSYAMAHNLGTKHPLRR